LPKVTCCCGISTTSVHVLWFGGSITGTESWNGSRDSGTALYPRKCVHLLHLSRWHCQLTVETGNVANCPARRYALHVSVCVVISPTFENSWIVQLEGTHLTFLCGS
jgi:hypothetical protein